MARGFALAADARGVNIIEHCDVTGMIVEGGAIQGVCSTWGEIRAPKVGLAVAGSTSTLIEMAGFRVPIETQLLPVFVSEAPKPLIDCVVTFGAGHLYVSQSDKGGGVFPHLDPQRNRSRDLRHHIEPGLARRRDNTSG